MADQLKQEQELLIVDAVRWLRKTGKMSDVELQCIGGVVYAHKLILSAVNPFFEIMFAKCADRLTFACDVDAMKIIVDFLYTGETSATAVEDYALIEDILDVTHVMEITKLFDYYWFLFSMSLSIENFLLHLKTAEKYGRLNTVKDINIFMAKNLDNIVGKSQFYQLKEKQMENLIQVARDKNIPKEILVSTILNWGESDVQWRSRSVIKLIDCIGLSNVSNQYIYNLYQSKLVLKFESLKQILINEAIQRLRVTGENELPYEDEENFRGEYCQLTEDLCSPTDGNLTAATLCMCISLFSVIDGNYTKEVQRYNFKEKVWSKKLSIKFARTEYSSLYMLTDSNGKPNYFTHTSQRKIAAYKLEKGFAVVGPTFLRKPLHGVKVGASFCFLNDDIVAQYCTEMEQWHSIALPVENDENNTIMSVGDQLFLYNNGSKILQVYDFDTQEWYTESTSPEQLYPIWTKCFQPTCRGKLYFSNSKFNLVTFDTTSKKWDKRVELYLANALPILANCDQSIVTYRKRDKLMLYDYGTGRVEFIPDGFSTELFLGGTRDIYLIKEDCFGEFKCRECF